MDSADPEQLLSAGNGDVQSLPVPGEGWRVAEGSNIRTGTAAAFIFLMPIYLF